MAIKKNKKKRTAKVAVVRAGTEPHGQETGKRGKPYPARTLEEALKIPQAIRDNNNGNPWSSDDVAQAALGLKKNNNKVFYATAAARDYGLTVGTRDTEKIELTTLGRSIVFAGDEATRREALIEAFFNVDIFKRVYEHYGSATLPEAAFLSNTLQGEFGLDASLHDEFTSIFISNCKFLGIQDGLDDAAKARAVGKTVESVQHPSDIKVVGEPKGKFDRTAFVIMPFVEKGATVRPSGFFVEVLKSLITPAGNQAGFAVETAAVQGSDVIQSTIINQLLTADLVIADLTDHNPNVLFELGIRLAKELPVALIKAQGTAPLFDVDNMMRVSAYSPTLWASTISSDVQQLQDHFKASWDNRDTGKGYMQILTGRTT